MHRAHRLYTQEQQGPSDAELLAQHGRIIERCARRIAARVGSPELANELWSAGALGLLDAARRFDGARGIKFESFVEHRVRGAMLDELRRMDHLPRRLRQQTDKLRQAREKLATELGRAPSSEELARRVDLPISEVDELVALTEPLVRLDEKNEPPPDPDVASIETQIDHQKLLARTAEAVASLPERQQLVMSLHYVEGFTYREIAHVLNVSEPRVCQIHGEALKKLRAVLGADEL